MQISKVSNFITQNYAGTGSKQQNQIKANPFQNERFSIQNKNTVSNNPFGQQEKLPEVKDLKISAQTLSTDLQKFGSYYTYFEPEVTNIQVNPDKTVNYTVHFADEGAMYGEDEGQHFYMQWTGKLEGKEIVERQPLHDINIRTGGTLTDGLSVSNIRFGKHENYERIVLDFEQGGYGGIAGEKSDIVGTFNIFQSQNQDDSAAIFIEVSGVRASNVQNFPKGDIVKGIEGWAIYDDSSIGFKINLDKVSSYKVTELEKPGRLVIDIMK